MAARLPACDTDVAGSYKCALAAAKPTLAQLSRSLGPRRKMIQGVVAFQLDKQNQVAGMHTQVYAATARTALNPTNSCANARSTHAHDNREPEVIASDEGSNPGTTDDGVASRFIIETDASYGCCIQACGVVLLQTGSSRVCDDGPCARLVASEPSRAQIAAATVRHGQSSRCTLPTPVEWSQISPMLAILWDVFRPLPTRGLRPLGHSCGVGIKRCTLFGIPLLRAFLSAVAFRWWIDVQLLVSVVYDAIRLYRRHPLTTCGC